MTFERLQLGTWGEEQAARFLRRSGMKILHRNYRTPVGEIDIIARQRKTVIFVEVKTRSGSCFGAPGEAVHAAKQRQVLRAAQWYLQQEKAADIPLRFDVVSVLQQDGGTDIEHIPDAFGMPE